MAQGNPQVHPLIAAERQLVRLGLDLHDGPAQEASALLADLRMFRGQLAAELAGHTHEGALVGRADDLEHRAAALEASIRELARTAGGPATIDGPLAAALREEARAFAEATAITPELTVSGPVDDSTPSQRIAVLRGVQEALRNAREHAEPTAVQITVTAVPDGLEVEVSDDGKGFAPEQTEERARQAGRMGMAGIRDRAELLGGSCQITSRPGGPTLVRLTLPRWKSGER